MRDALIIRHVAFEDLGHLIDILPDHDYQPYYLDAGRDELSPDALHDTDLLILLGGPISANDEADYPFLQVERQAAAKRISAGRPTLGICLGAQIMARAVGARVYPGPAKEIGWSALTLTHEGQTSCLRHLLDTPVLHWHGETFDIPDHAEHLASTEVCNNQAFRIDNHALALQFHPEVTTSELECWYIGHTLELSTMGIDINTIRQQSQQQAPRLKTAARGFFAEWLGNLN